MTLLAIAGATTSAPSWTGSIPTWLLLVLALIAAWRISRGGGGSAVTELSKANEVLKVALDDERTLSEGKEKRIAALEANIIALEARTDVVLAVRPLMEELDRKAQERYEDAQRRSQESHTATLNALLAMTNSLNQLREAA